MSLFYLNTFSFPDAGNKYSNEVRKEHLQRHVDKGAKMGVTDSQSAGTLRRSTRKRLEPKWRKDYVSIKGGSEQKLGDA